MEYNKILDWVKSENIRGYELETDRCIADVIENFLNENKEAINYSHCCESDSELLCDCKEQTTTLRVGFNGKSFCEKCGRNKA